MHDWEFYPSPHINVSLSSCGQRRRNIVGHIMAAYTIAGNVALGGLVMLWVMHRLLPRLVKVQVGRIWRAARPAEKLKVANTTHAHALTYATPPLHNVLLVYLIVPDSGGLLPDSIASGGGFKLG